MYVAHQKGFGAFGGAWEDWCDSAIAEGRLPEEMREKCKRGGICSISPPYTAWGAACRGIPNVGYNQSFWAKAGGAVSAFTSGTAAVLTLGLSTIGSGGPAGLVDTIKEGGEALVGAVKSAAGEAQKVVGSVMPAPPPVEQPVRGPQQANILGGTIATMLIGGAVLGAVAHFSKNKKRRRRK